jgi:hypothetical protein
MSAAFRDRYGIMRVGIGVKVGASLRLDGMHLALYVAAGIVTAAALGVATLLRRQPRR